MSGPKRSRYSINNSIRRQIAEERRREAEKRRNEYLERVARREAQAREKAALRAEKELDLQKAVIECRDHLHMLVKEYDARAVDAQRIEGWLDSAESCAKGDLRSGWRELNGARAFLKRKEDSLKKRPVQQNGAEIEEALGLSEAELVLSEVEDVLSDNPDVSNTGITQRLDLIRAALKINRENPNTLEQVKSLLAKIYEIVEEYEIRKKEREYAIRAFAEVIGAELPGPGAAQGAMARDGNHHENVSLDEKKNSGGGVPPASFSGSIGGMPITVVFEADNAIQLNTPENGNCKTPLKTLMNKLSEKGVDLGSVRIVRTGENWNPVSQDSVQKKTRA